MLDYIAYMENIARKLKAIGHDPVNGKTRFFRVRSIVDLDELQQNLTGDCDPCIVAEDNHQGRFNDSGSESITDEITYSFMILKRAKLNDFAAEQTVKKDCHRLFLKIAGRMRRDSRGDFRGDIPSTGMKHLVTGSFYHQSVGPVSDNFFGTLVTFSILIPTANDLKYDAQDWN